MWLILSFILIAISLILLRKSKKILSLLAVTISLIFALSSPGWYIILDLRYDLFLALLFGVVSLLCALIFSTREDKTKSRSFIIVFTVILWFSLFRGTTRANELYDNSDEQIMQVQIIDVTDFGAGRGDFLYYFGYKKTELSCTVLEEEIVFTVPTNSCMDLSIGESIIVGTKDGVIGLKYCYVIFDENYQVATEYPEKRMQGRYFFI